MVRDTSATLVYVGDPMCSWCWGFAPVLERLIDEHELPLRIVVGGLRPGPAAQELTPQLEQFLLHHWDRVAEVSGQPFKRETLSAKRPGWRYDTEPPAVAVVTMRAMKPEAELEFFFRLQRGFYADGVDIVDPAVYPALLDGIDIDPADFARKFASEEMHTEAWRDFDEARRLGVSGFPTTLVQFGDRYRMLAAGYQPYAQVDELLHAVLDRLDPTTAGDLMCAANGGAC